MISRFQGVDAKLERAQEHFDIVKKMTNDYIAQDFDPIRIELDAQGKGWAASRLPPPDPKLPPIVGDCIHNLRSALDHWANRLVEFYGSEATDQTSFPVLEVAPTANKKGISPPPHIDGLDRAKASAVLAVIALEQPYRTPGEWRTSNFLWVLNEMWNQDKHRGLIENRIWRQNVSFKGVGGPIVGELRKVGVNDDVAVLKFFPDDSSVDVEGEGTTAIGIAPGLAWEGGSLVTVLRELSRYVSGLIQRMENAL